MKTFIVRVLFGFAIGLSTGSAFAAAPHHRDLANVPGDEFLETETFIIKLPLKARVDSALAKLGLSADVDYAWLSRVGNKHANLVCYSAECHEWAQKSRLKTIAKVPHRKKEEAVGKTWRDAAIDSKKNRELSEEEKIKNRHLIPYSRVKNG